MSSVATSLAVALPKPKYNGQYEELPSHTQTKGPKLLGVSTGSEKQIVLQVRIPSRITLSDLTLPS